MLVEINLLKKEKKDTIFYIIILIGFMLLVIGSISIFWKYHSVNQKMQTLQQQVTETKQLVEMRQSKLQEIRTTTASEELKATVDWVEDYQLSTVYLLRHLSSLLPERGFILNFSYSESGTVSLNVQFDTSRQAAYYLKELKDSKIIKSVTLSNLSTKEISTEIENIETNEYVPRYMGNYQLEVNKDELQRAMKEGS